MCKFCLQNLTVICLALDCLLNCNYKCSTQINEIFRNTLSKFYPRISSTYTSSALQRILLFNNGKNGMRRESASRKTVINLMDFRETRQIAT